MTVFRCLALAFVLALSGCASSPPEAARGGATGANPTPAPPSPEASGEILDLHTWAERSGWAPAAVATVLAVVAGEVPPQEAFGEEVYLHAVGPVAVVAEQLLAEGAFDAETRTDVERRLRKLNPPQDVLDQISRRVDEPIFQKISARSDADLCLSAWQDGFPADTPYADLDCYVYDTYPLGTDRYRIYVPESYRDDASRMAMVRAAGEAVVRADAFYTRLESFRPIRIVFTPAPATVGGMPASVLAHVPGLVPAAYCPITVWAASEGLGLGDFRQTVAHEIFHCVQEDTRGLGPLAPNAYEDAEWWVEGAAEYFSNVVYPRVDYEDRWLSKFETNAFSMGIHEMSYEANLFFQYLEQALGEPGAVFAFMSRLSTQRGEAAQVAALSAQPGIDRIFHDFAEAYADGGIMDTGRRPIRRLRLEPIYIVPTDSEQLNNRPFRLKFFDAEYDEGEKVTVRLGRDGDGLSGRLSTRPAPDDGTDWQETERVEIDGCDNTGRFFLVTSTDPSTRDEVVFDYEPTVEEADDCEEEEEPPPVACGPVPECVVGTWEPAFDTVFSDANMRAMYPDDRGQALQFDGASGQVRLRIDASGAMTYTYDNLAIRTSGNTSSGQVQTRMTFHGESAAQACDADGRLQFEPRESDVRTNVTMTIPGIGEVDGPMNLNDVFSEAEQGSATYTCSDSTLRLTISGPTPRGSLTMFRDATYSRR